MKSWHVAVKYLPHCTVPNAFENITLPSHGLGPLFVTPPTTSLPLANSIPLPHVSPVDDP